MSVTANTTPVRAPMTLTEAMEIANDLFADTVERMLDREINFSAYQEYLAKAIAVPMAYDASIRMLWALLEALAVKAAANLESLKTREARFEDKTGWMARSIAEAQKVLQAPHTSTLPQAGETFEAQRLSGRNRATLCSLIEDLQKIAYLGVCKKCRTAPTRWNVKYNNFYRDCQECSGFIKPVGRASKTSAAPKYTMGADGGSATPEQLEDAVRRIGDRGIRLALKDRPEVVSGKDDLDASSDTETSNQPRVRLNPADVDADAEVATVEKIGKKRERKPKVVATLKTADKPKKAKTPARTKTSAKVKNVRPIEVIDGTL
ncbi:hypothetical protein COY48_02165 [Candidatus Collierbacteria bacterium CG_4_10_14_0_8_um_filter_43_86]|uniref:Uncharacterized protein n=1 Tax=Candidatus Collierbacteria bacterium CG_4_9_14_3_um_filter_43_16 TaxID=1974532 RepID=A0A2M8BTC0_9BACT|nr:MAG: hypothetical protein COY48_02165 [Candidatus Collierbacteria bacterium CG_4_10_14_0_8_um_filter_43_86]PJB47096.1 MAG: hypothetical protein CO104_04505 [Candidatus Collierbacteria bacterium CG_4_9_14_3_um_filter_43_16]